MRSQKALAPIALALASCVGSSPAPTKAKSTSYDDLIALFADWRAFQKPQLADGVPDYGKWAMRDQHRALGDYRKRLAGIDRSGWPVAQQVDRKSTRLNSSHS